MQELNAVAFDYDDVLLCPGCGENYLHHRGVTIWQRREDAETTCVTEVSWNPTTQRATVNDQSMPSVWTERNPSRRRYGLAIQFDCEHCLEQLELCVSQDKGQTHLRWRRIESAYQRESTYEPV